MPQLMPLMWSISFLVFLYLVMINSIMYGDVIIFKVEKKLGEVRKEFQWWW